MTSILAELDPALPPGELLLERRETERHRPLFLALTRQAVRNFQNEVDSYVFLVRDVTEAHLEDLLRQDFLSLVSHKLLTPLTGINASLTMLRTRFPDESASALIETVAKQSALLIKLVNRLLNFVREEREVLSREGQSATIDETLAACAGRYPEKKFVLDKTASAEKLGKNRMVILGELIDNAFKFHDKAILHLGVTADRNGLSVSDDGPGIPPEERENIFQAFYLVEKDFTGNVPGAGLGLALVKKITDLGRGDIKLQSALGEGTTFTIRFPER